MQGGTRLVLKEDDLVAVLSPAGEASGSGPEGLYTRDTRHLSLYRLLIDDDEPVHLASDARLPYACRLWMTNRARAGGPPSEGFTLVVERRMVVSGEAFGERITVTHHGTQPAEIRWGLELGADFRDMMAVRGYPSPQAARPQVQVRDGGRRVAFSCAGSDGVTRWTRVVADPAAHVDVQGDRARLLWCHRLLPGQPVAVEVWIEPGGDGPPYRSTGGPCPAGAARVGEPGQVEAAIRLVGSRYADWQGEVAHFETGCEPLNRLIYRGLEDLRALQSDFGWGPFPVAGIPWFAVPFGRDSLWTARFALTAAPQLARAVLFTLARHQADEDRAWTDAEPGKIPHELRFGELTRMGLLPFGPYYGTADATPLFVALAADYALHTGRFDDFVELRPAVQRALGWIERHGDPDGDGFVEYRRRSPAGLDNQGWKDSWDSVWHADGRLAEPPIALVEVQGYVYRALVCMARVLERLGEVERARDLVRRSYELAGRFERAFWLEPAGFYAAALDGAKEPVAVLTSNAAHVLWSGLASPKRAARLAGKLLGPACFSGWGLRTVAAGQARYNPVSYHNGSVWPHDTAIAAAGLASYGLVEEASRLVRGLVEASAYFTDGRLPELFCGFDAGDGPPVAYPVACSPQAWSAAAPLFAVSVLTGLRVDGARRGVEVAGRVPAWLGKVTVRGLAAGPPSHRVDLVLEPRSAPHGGRPDALVPVRARLTAGQAELVVREPAASLPEGVPPSRG